MIYMCHLLSETNCIISSADLGDSSTMTLTLPESTVPITTVTIASVIYGNDSGPVNSQPANYSDKDNGPVTSQTANTESDSLGLIATVVTVIIVLLGVVIVLVVLVLVVKIR